MQRAPAASVSTASDLTAALLPALSIIPHPQPHPESRLHRLLPLLARPRHARQLQPPSMANLPHLNQVPPRLQPPFMVNLPHLSRVPPRLQPLFMVNLPRLSQVPPPRRHPLFMVNLPHLSQVPPRLQPPFTANLPHLSRVPPPRLHLLFMLNLPHLSQVPPSRLHPLKPPLRYTPHLPARSSLQLSSIPRQHFAPSRLHTRLALQLASKSLPLHQLFSSRQQRPSAPDARQNLLRLLSTPHLLLPAPPHPVHRSLPYLALMSFLNA